MSTLVAIDPGYAASGAGSAVAVFRDMMLARVYFARPGTIRDNARPDRIVWEMPQLDSRSHASAPAVLRLAAEGATLAGMLAGVGGPVPEPIAPSAWKGSTPKPIHHDRLWAKLTDAERAVLGGDATRAQIDLAIDRGASNRWAKPGASYYPASFAEHNLLDAVGIGVFALGR